MESVLSVRRLRGIRTLKSEWGLLGLQRSSRTRGPCQFNNHPGCNQPHASYLSEPESCSLFSDIIVPGSIRCVSKVYVSYHVSKDKDGKSFAARIPVNSLESISTGPSLKR
jgi:hypothetical protein